MSEPTYWRDLVTLPDGVNMRNEAAQVAKEQYRARKEAEKFSRALWAYFDSVSDT